MSVPFSPEVMREAEDRAAIGSAFLALEFVSQTETWPVFQAWLKTASSVRFLGRREDMAILLDNLAERMRQ